MGNISRTGGIGGCFTVTENSFEALFRTVPGPFVSNVHFKLCNLEKVIRTEPVAKLGENDSKQAKKSFTRCRVCGDGKDMLCKLNESRHGLARMLLHVIDVNRIWAPFLSMKSASFGQSVQAERPTCACAFLDSISIRASMFTKIPEPSK